MNVTIDETGRVVIPKILREQAGFVAGAVLRIELDGVGVRIEAAAGEGLEHQGRFLVIPTTGAPIDDDAVARLRHDAQK